MSEGQPDFFGLAFLVLAVGASFFLATGAICSIIQTVAEVLA